MRSSLKRIICQIFSLCHRHLRKTANITEFISINHIKYSYSRYRRNYRIPFKAGPNNSITTLKNKIKKRRTKNTVFMILFSVDL